MTTLHNRRRNKERRQDDRANYGRRKTDKYGDSPKEKVEDIGGWIHTLWVKMWGQKRVIRFHGYECDGYRLWGTTWADIRSLRNIPLEQPQVEEWSTALDACSSKQRM